MLAPFGVAVVLLRRHPRCLVLAGQLGQFRVAGMGVGGGEDGEDEQRTASRHTFIPRMGRAVCQAIKAIAESAGTRPLWLGSIAPGA